MIKDDCKSGASVPKNFKQTSSKTQNTFMSQVMDPGTQEVALALSLVSDSFFFELIAGKYAESGMTVRRTDPRDGPVTYFVILDGKVYEHRTLLELYRIARAWEKDHV